jgi:phosphoribosyl 1,2-cyclic phosphate phosphodiesterase
MSLSLRILGCGSSGGVPRADGVWGACDPSNPRNVRTRCSALIRLHGPEGVTTLLIDTAPEFRQQAVAAGLKTVDAVLFTHDHADQVGGIDDLRAFAYRRRSRIPGWMWPEACPDLPTRFSYIFEEKPGSGYPALVDRHTFTAGDVLRIAGAGGEMVVQTLALDHGVPCTGVRIGGVAYCNDVVRLPDATLDKLTGLDLLVVDALRDAPHPTHANVEQALAWIEQLKPRHAILTNLHIDLDYKELSARLPTHVVPAHDGLEWSTSS